MTDILITAEHLHEARRRHSGYCTRGMDVWFQRHGLSMRTFLREGYPASVIEGTGDTLGLQVVAIAREQQ